MSKTVRLLVLSVLFGLLGVVSVAYAQGVNPFLNITPDEFVRRLGISASRAVTPLMAILLYASIVMSFVTMFGVPDKQSNLGFMMVFNVLAAFLAKIQFFYICGLVTLALNVTLMVVPLLVAGMSRGEPGRPPRSLATGIITGLIGGAYFFLCWALVQANPAFCVSVGGVDQAFGPFL
ncbi:MAG: hypothetical protein MUC99_09550 [Anaerolineae bacterium]|jgi:hypothetical protein|nr:hypothetical protein [Anaerolineae bacterium]